MRILHVTDTYLPRRGGIELTVSDLACQQRLVGHEVDVLTLTRSALESEAAVRPPSTAGLLAKARFVHTNRRLGEVAGYDVVHAHCSTMSPLSYATIGAAAGVPTAITVHSLWRRYTAFYGTADHLLGWSRWPVAWSAVSTAAATAVQRAARSDLRVDVVPNGIDLTQWPQHRRQLDITHLRIVSVMRLAPRKRPLPLLRILRNVRAGLPDEIRVSAVVVGDGPRMKAARRFTAANDMDDWVTFTGHLPRTSIDEHLTNADVFVAPATLESFGIAALEAAASGLPVIGRAGTGLSDFLELGVSGLLLPSDAGIAEALIDLASGARQLQAPAHAQLLALSWRAVLERIDRLYQRAGATTSARQLEERVS
jgi:phosphatidylinositol alpha 1,6-mannosyltransferase